MSFDDFLKQQGFVQRSPEQIAKEMMMEQLPPVGEQEAEIVGTEFNQVYSEKHGKDFYFVNITWKFPNANGLRQKQSFDVGNPSYGPDNVKKVEEMLYQLKAEGKTFDERLSSVVGRNAKVFVKHKQTPEKVYCQIFFRELIDAAPIGFNEEDKIPF